MYVILAVSITALAISCERAAYLFFKLKLNVDSTYFRIAGLLEKMNYKGALEECSKIDNHPLGRILKSGLLKADKRDKEIELAMEENIMR
jgi:biopolymer transport protein ExbB/TolQ